MFYTYVLESRISNNIYVGSTSDLEKRLREHNSGKMQSTKRYAPWSIIYYEACLNEKDARRREQYWKTSQGRRMLKRRLKEYFYKKKE